VLNTQFPFTFDAHKVAPDGSAEGLTIAYIPAAFNTNGIAPDGTPGTNTTLLAPVDVLPFDEISDDSIIDTDTTELDNTDNTYVNVTLLFNIIALPTYALLKRDVDCIVGTLELLTTKSGCDASTSVNDSTYASEPSVALEIDTFALTLEPFKYRE